MLKSVSKEVKGMSTDGGIQKNQLVYQWKQHPFSSFSVGIKSFITGKTIENIVVIETKYSIEEIDYGKKSIFG